MRQKGKVIDESQISNMSSYGNASSMQIKNQDESSQIVEQTS